MKMAVLILFLLTNVAIAQPINDERANTPVPFTLADRDRLLKLEVKVDEMEKRNQERFETMQKQFDMLQKQYDDLKTEIHWIIGLIVGLIGFIIWDRTTFIKPIEKRLTIVENQMNDFNKIERNKIQQLISVLKELSKTDKNVADVLKQFNIL